MKDKRVERGNCLKELKEEIVWLLEEFVFRSGALFAWFGFESLTIFLFSLILVLSSGGHFFSG